jgi:sporulation protein YpjB
MFTMVRRVRSATLIFMVMALIAVCSACGKQADSMSEAPPVPAEELRNAVRLNETAGEAYRLAAAGEFSEARRKFRELGAQMIGMHYNGLTSVEGLEALSAAAAQAIRAFNAVQLQPDEALFAAAKVRLAVDALDRSKEPLWLQYYKVIQDDNQAIGRSVQAKSRDTYLQAWSSLQMRYATIRPAIAVSREPYETEKADSLMKAIGTEMKASAPNQRHLLTLLRHLEETMDSLFRKKDADAAYLPIVDPNQPIYWTFAVAALIVAALAYTGWRMYHSEKRSTPVKLRDKPGR